MIKFILHLHNLIWVWWSNLHYKHMKAELHSTEVDKEDIVRTMPEISALVQRLHKRFEYKDDGIELLWDAVVPPCEAYKKYKEGLLKDDCDGFHSLVYHCLKQSGIKTYLLTAQTSKEGHCVSVFKQDGFWYIVDYGYIFGSYETLEDIIKKFNDYFSKKYVDKAEVKLNALYEYNYEKGKIVMINYKKALSEN